jgi:hypothetical protein
MSGRFGFAMGAFGMVSSIFMIAAMVTKQQRRLAKKNANTPQLSGLETTPKVYSKDVRNLTR